MPQAAQNVDTDKLIRNLRTVLEGLNHVVVPNPRIQRLRAHEISITSSLNAMAEAVLRECEDHDVGTEEWKSGIPDEFRFWWNVIARRTQAPDAKAFLEKFTLAHEFDYAGYIGDTDRSELEVLDIGCAIFPAIGKKFGTKTIKVVAADPLAVGYNRLMDLFGIKRQYDLVFAVAEKTADIFGDERFDFVLAQNSIDHSYDPCAAFTQISRSIRKGGGARFEHFLNEAQNQNYQGFHKWNLEPADGNRIRVWNRTSDSVFNFSDHGCTADVKPYIKKRAGVSDVQAFAVSIRKS
ncbi:MAG: methyltransferase domain-containing protein [Albidovulum sp.]